ncbi:MAG: respiratory nitrate reductase subunit gamma [Pseudonocardiaceae bacterium]
MTGLLWVTVPYVAFTSFLLGHIWRYRHDQFGWTTRSSQLHESRLLRLGSPLFHFGLLAVLGGHVLGIAIPASWTAAVGVSEHAYHLMSVSFGTLSGLATVAGLEILLYRRSAVPAGLPDPALRRLPQPRCHPPRHVPLRPRLGGIRTPHSTPLAVSATGKDPEGRNRTIILWREVDLVGGTVVRRVVVTVDATVNTATVLTCAQAVEAGRCAVSSSYPASCH